MCFNQIQISFNTVSGDLVDLMVAEDLYGSNTFRCCMRCFYPNSSP